MIHSLLPDPEGSDRKLEVVTLENKSSVEVCMDGWSLRDADNHAVDLTGSGTIPPGKTLEIVRDGSPLSLNNDGDTITLFGPGTAHVDGFGYDSSKEGVTIRTGH